MPHPDPEDRPVPADPADRADRADGERTAVHVPVLAVRVGELLAPAIDAALDATDSATVVDATLGLGGHTLALLTAHPRLHIVGIDRDRAALAIAGDRLERAGVADRVTLVHAVYDEIGDVLDERAAAGTLPGAAVAGILFDLGVSSLQLDEADRGFAYAQDAALDMRMDPTTGNTAADVLNTYSVGELTRILREYGEERFALRLARAVVRAREREPFTTSARLVELIRDGIPAAARRTGGHPAKRTFQALRIEVNDELGALRRALPAALDHLRVAGRIVVLSYQSLEDRIVKRELVARSTSTAPPDLPFDVPGHAPSFRMLTRGAEQATPDEVDANPRAASVRMRAAERVAA